MAISSAFCRALRLQQLLLLLLLRGVARVAHAVEAGLAARALGDGALGALVERPEELVGAAELASERLRLTQLRVRVS